jgi:YHS domain-containing protein
MKKIFIASLMFVLGLSLTIPMQMAATNQGSKAPAKETTAKVKDPVCGMQIDPAKSTAQSVYKEKTYHFCSSHCKAEFDKNPSKYIK